MDPLSAALLGSSALSAVGSIAGGLFGSSGAKSANKANKAMMQEAETFDNFESSTAYQRGTLDAEKAGLNPLLVAQNGGASAPTIQAPVMQNANLPLAQGISQAANSARDAVTQYANLQQTQASLVQAKSQATLNNNLAFKALADTVKSQMEGGVSGLQYKAALAEMPGILKQAAFDNSRIGQGVQTLDKVMDPLARVMGTATSAAKLGAALAPAP